MTHDKIVAYLTCISRHLLCNEWTPAAIVLDDLRRILAASPVRPSAPVPTRTSGNVDLSSPGYQEITRGPYVLASIMVHARELVSDEGEGWRGAMEALAADGTDMVAADTLVSTETERDEAEEATREMERERDEWKDKCEAAEEGARGLVATIEALEATIAHLSAGRAEAA